MNAIIVDDDLMVRKMLSEIVKKIPNVDLVEEFEDAESALVYLNRNEVDLVFLDIQMPGMSGLEMISALKTSPEIVMIISNAEFAAETYNYDVADFIVKPLDKERVSKAVEKVEKLHASFKPLKLNRGFAFVKDGTVIKKLKLSEVSWVEAFGDYVKFYLESGKKITVLSTMKGMEGRLPENFARIHRSYIIPIEKIGEIEDNTVVLGDKLLPLSKHYKESFLKLLDHYLMTSFDKSHFFEISFEVMLVLNDKVVIVDTNPVFPDLIGGMEVLNVPFIDFVHEKDLEIFSRRFKKFLDKDSGNLFLTNRVVGN